MTPPIQHPPGLVIVVTYNVKNGKVSRPWRDPIFLKERRDQRRANRECIACGDKLFIIWLGKYCFKCSAVRRKCALDYDAKHPDRQRVSPGIRKRERAKRKNEYYDRKASSKCTSTGCPRDVEKDKNGEPISGMCPKHAKMSRDYSREYSRTHYTMKSVLKRMSDWPYNLGINIADARIAYLNSNIPAELLVGARIIVCERSLNKPGMREERKAACLGTSG